MDHRKLLIIILSVALFVALILGIALLAYYPGDEDEHVAQRERQEFDPIEFVRRSEDPEPELTDEDDDDEFVIIYGTREPDDEIAVRPGPEEREVREPARPEPEPTERPEREPEPPRPEPEPEPEPREEPEPAEPEVRQPAARPAPERPSREYWIQVISSSSRDSAEAAKARLRDQSLGSVIFPVTVDGRNYYRVRVGPYDSRGEADKFLEWVQNLDGFEQSYVSLVTRS